MNIYNAISKVCIKLFVLLTILQVCAVFSVIHDSPDRDRDNTTYEADNKNPANAKQTRWAKSAHDYITALDCSQSIFISDVECQQVKELNSSQINIYLADPSYDRYRIVIPDDNLERDDAHDGVLVVDPYPHANFGHLVFTFFIDLNFRKDWCTQDHGIMLEGGECMTLALKRRCQSVRDARSRKRSFARRCKMNFIPLVYHETDYFEPQQKLTCRSNIPGFARCPVLRDVSETNGIVCQPTASNPTHCVTAEQHVHTSCRTLETCDQAVIISGGWNRWTSQPHQKDSAWAMYHLVKNHGFLDKNVKVFYANGAPGIKKEPHLSSSHVHEVYPAVYKTALRNHIQKVCSSSYCADSFVIYMNGPSRMDASTLLWDVDKDGVANDDEMYKLEELLGDIANCKSTVVHLISDQSYSGEISKAVRRSQNHRNVAIYASGKDHEYSISDDFSQVWANTNHTTTCMREVFKESRRLLQGSTPDHEQGQDVRNVNIFGAPCNVVPPYSNEELRLDFLGCQSVPTSKWLNELYNDDTGNSISSGVNKRDSRDLRSKRRKLT